MSTIETPTPTAPSRHAPFAVGWSGTLVSLVFMALLGLAVGQLHQELVSSPRVESPLGTAPILPIWAGAALFTLAYMAGLAAHEAGHALAGRATGRRLIQVTVCPRPFTGTSLVMSGTTPTRWDQVGIALAGPVAQLVYGAALFAILFPGLGWWMGATPLGLAALLSMVRALAHLGGSSDGRKVARGLWQVLSRRPAR